MMVLIKLLNPTGDALKMQKLWIQSSLESFVQESGKMLFLQADVRGLWITMLTATRKKLLLLKLLSENNYVLIFAQTAVLWLNK